MISNDESTLFLCFYLFPFLLVQCLYSQLIQKMPVSNTRGWRLLLDVIGSQRLVEVKALVVTLSSFLRHDNNKKVCSEPTTKSWGKFELRKGVC
mmetsp:Transcript_9060/g.16565  ORF Transcript_9060/g.16565 Transcript_9060/m.16565 type:complete len:94 (-) Transcript_9060:632-913(-)